MVEKNAVIEYVRWNTERCLTLWIGLDYGDGGHQGFGGFVLGRSDLERSAKDPNCCGYYVSRLMEIAGVDDLNNAVGRCVRVRGKSLTIGDSQPVAIGHIVKNDWFNPTEDFKKMREVRGE